MHRLRLSLVLVALAASACRSAPQTSELAPAAPPPAPLASSEPIRLTVVGTNDLHGWIAPLRTSLKGGVEVEEGGVATLAGYVARLRADNPGGVLLLDG